jgi:hypothetical protein
VNQNERQLVKTTREAMWNVPVPVGMSVVELVGSSVVNPVGVLVGVSV